MIFVTGITGIVGTGFVHYLKENNFMDEIKVLVRPTSDLSCLKGLNVTICYGNLSSISDDDIASLVSDCDTIIHIASKSRIFQFAEIAVKSPKVKKIILISSTSHFSEIKECQYLKELENKSTLLLDKHKIDWTIIRPTMIFGERSNGRCDKNVSRLKKIANKFPFIPAVDKGSALLQPVWGRDVGKAIFLVLTNADLTSHKFYTVSGDRPLKYVDFMKILRNKKSKRLLSINKNFAMFLIKSAYIFSFHRFDRRHELRRLLENRAFPSTEITIDLGYKATNLEESLKIYNVE